MTFPTGIQLLVLAGSQAAPTPLGPDLAALLIEAQVAEVADGQATFRLTFAGRRIDDGLGPEVAALADGRLAPGCRVVICVLLDALPTPLIDGLVTDLWLDPSRHAQAARVVVSGADLSVAMDLTESITGWPDMDEEMIVLALIAEYARFAIVPETVPPPDIDLPTPVQRTPIQHGTDLDTLYALADRFGYVFTVRPGPVPLTNTAYWGPPRRVGLPAPALTVGDTAFANVDGLTFGFDGHAAFTVAGLIPGSTEADPDLAVTAIEPTLIPLALHAPYPAGPMLRRRLPNGSDAFGEGRAEALAQGRVNRASDRTVRAEGSLDVPRYGSVLRAGGLVGVRGAGASFDGLWSIETVTHTMRRRAYRQSFSLARGGLDPLEPLVVP